MGWDEGVISGKELSSQVKTRKDRYVHESINKLLTEQYLQDGWELERELKNKNKVKRLKPSDEQFEDEVWALLASLGFKLMNGDRQLRIPYDNNKRITKQIDVFAADDETILLVECKSAEAGRRGNFKTELEAIKGYQKKLFSEVQRAFPSEPKRKPKYILATKNYEIGEQDLARMKSFGVQHFSSRMISYYSELAKHLGEAARFQLLGQLFGGKEISSMDNRIPAVKGVMGGQIYYSFSIEPENLLKIAYILHRTDANEDMMPTYQRIIKKKRLTEIQKFIDEGGYFPNSIIISIDTRGRGLQFDQASLKGDTDTTKIGILHLPQRYRTAYVIDGQHRLYGYSNSRHIATDAIPIVAFEDLDKERQVDLFIQINENQKSVPKNLRNTLIADLLWDDPDLNKQRGALRAKIALDLGERPASPLYERIRIGENEMSPNCNITMQAIQDGLKMSKFLSTFDKSNTISSNGTFDKGDNQSTYKNLYEYLVLCFGYLRDNLSEEWKKGADELGVLVINNSILAIIRVLNDIVQLLIEHALISIPVDDPKQVFQETQYYLDPLIQYIQTINEDERLAIKKERGSGAIPRVFRRFQEVIADKRDDFEPEGLEEWRENNSRQYNEQSFSMLQAIELFLNKDFKNRLESHYGDNWLIDGLPRKVYSSSVEIAAGKDFENKLRRGDTDPWDCLFIINYREIAINGRNWSEIFEKHYTRPGEANIRGGKEEKTKWIVELNDIRNSIVHGNYSVTKGQFDLLSSLYEWLIK